MSLTSLDGKSSRAYVQNCIDKTLISSRFSESSRGVCASSIIDRRSPGAMGPRQCEVCREAQSKYKCPSCLLPYCSLACFKKHKENTCKKSSLSVRETTNIVLPEKSYQVNDSRWVVPEDQLQRIVESKEIQDVLKDEELWKLIYKIDCSEDPEDELDKAMQGQTFCDFTHKILSIVSPQC